ncbi:MAG: alpha-N-acetylglucosaminidase C-terminal domain-containing protein, partial [Gemmatimonadetes bacterium]|nr:alpha-N-acetylglucosaminidase C-terminal domain-containing protein [Gemmatimonadota bacterium]
MKKHTLVALLLSLSCNSPSQPPPGPVQAVEDLVIRLFGGSVSSFHFELLTSPTEFDIFEIEGTGSNVTFRGNNANALASALNHYLKYYCWNHVSIYSDYLLLPDPLPDVPTLVHVESRFKIRHFDNYVAANYSKSFWDWPEWERYIDWLALSGVNLAQAAVVGVEAVWQNTLIELGITDSRNRDFLAGPGFTAFGGLGLLQGYGGPVSQAWIDRQADLQKKIVTRMKELGIEPILQGYIGSMPSALVSAFPQVEFLDIGSWVAWQRYHVIDYEDPFFDVMGQVWYEELEKLYGEIKYFGTDPDLEIDFGSGFDFDYALVGQKIQPIQLAANPEAVLVLQGWSGKPEKRLIEEMVREHVLIIDLWCDNKCQWDETEAFWGYPWIWSIIQNFGGTQQMGGDLQGIADKLFDALDSDSNGNMVGMGAVPEGIHSDPVLWDMMFDLTYRNVAPTMTAWLKDYAKRRYGTQSDKMEEAWELLYEALYDNGGYGEKLAYEPSFGRLAFDRGRLTGLVNIWKLFMEEAERFGSVEPFRYDMMDVTHEVFAMYVRSWMQGLSDLNASQTVTEFGTRRVEFMELLMDFDRVFTTHEHFSLCRWIGAARDLGSTEAEKDLFELNARLQVTIWGPGDTLNDYAAKTWGGLLKDFHARRWDAFLVNVEEGLKGNDPGAVDWIALEKEWTEETGLCDAPDSTGSMWEEIAYVAEKYFDIDFTPVPTDNLAVAGLSGSSNGVAH